MKPPKYTKAEFEPIFSRIAEGDALYKVCKEKGTMSLQHFYSCIAIDDSLFEKYVRAKELCADKIFEETKEIADGVKADNNEVQKARLQVDVRKWQAGKLRPKKYGDKLDLTTDGDKIEGIVYLPRKSDPDVVK